MLLRKQTLFQAPGMKVQNINNHLFLALTYTIKKVKSANVDKGLLEREALDETLIINRYQKKSCTTISTPSWNKYLRGLWERKHIFISKQTQILY